ncbi:MAG: CBS domain-containing protein [Anaerolineales bacterium]|jgi:acetoin utilization protein AcuB
MLVRDYLTRHPIMISPETHATEAQKIMLENKLRHLPVVGDGKRLLGLITRDRLSVPPSDLASLDVWEISRLLSNLEVKNLMLKRSELVTIAQTATLEEAAQTMLAQKVGCLPVIEDEIVIGIITENDLLTQLSNLLGGQVKGVRVTIRVPDKIGEFAKVTSAITAQGWGIYASGALPSPKRPGYWDLVVKVRNVSKEKVIAALQGIDGHEIIDIRITPCS